MDKKEYWYITYMYIPLNGFAKTVYSHTGISKNPIDWICNVQSEDDGEYNLLFTKEITKEQYEIMGKEVYR